MRFALSPTPYIMGPQITTRAADAAEVRGGGLALTVPSLGAGKRVTFLRPGRGAATVRGPKAGHGPKDWWIGGVGGSISSLQTQVGVSLSMCIEVFIYIGGP